MAKHKGLTRKQKQAIEHIKNGKKNSEICRLLKITATTLWRWRRDEKFKTALQQMWATRNREVSKKFVCLLEQAQDILKTAMDEKLDNMPGHIKVALELIKIYRPVLPTTEKASESQTTESQTTQTTESQTTVFEDLAKQIEAEIEEQVNDVFKAVKSNGKAQ